MLSILEAKEEGKDRELIAIRANQIATTDKYEEKVSELLRDISSRKEVYEGNLLDLTVSRDSLVEDCSAQSDTCTRLGNIFTYSVVLCFEIIIVLLCIV